VGTFAYLAPERLGGAAATPASDVWSVGVLLYESLTGQRPFSGDAPLAVAAAVQRGTYPALETARPDVRAATCSAVESALSPDPATRPSVEDLRATLTLAAPAHEAPARAASLVAVPALGAVDVLTQWLTPLVDAEKAPVNIPRRRRLRAWTVPGLVLGGVAAMVVVTTGAAGPGGPGASAGTPRADAAAAAPDTSPGPEPIPVKAPAPSRTAHPVRPAKTASPPGTSRGSSHAHRSATPTGSELSSAAGRQPQPDALHEQPNTVKNQEKTNGQQKGKGKQKGKAQGNARGEEGQGLEA
jgi:hypothetical protein